jgi:hypothetical protein
MTTNERGQLPHWDLSNVYPGLESEQFAQAVADLKAKLDELESYLAAHHMARTAGPPALNRAALHDILGGYLDRMNAALRLSRTLGVYVVRGNRFL